MKRGMLMLVGLLMTVLWGGTVSADDSRFVVSRKTVEDRRTHLIWVRNAGMGRMDWHSAAEFVKKLNADEYADANNWRLPSREELMTLVNYAVRAGYIGGMDYLPPHAFLNRAGFDDVQPNLYWSSSSYEDNASYAEVINMCNGVPRSENKESEFHVWPVRDGK